MYLDDNEKTALKMFLFRKNGSFDCFAFEDLLSI